MKKILVFTYLYSKRLLRRPAFLVILMLMPILVLALKLTLSADDDTMYVAIYDETGDERVKNALDDLVNNPESVTFYYAESEEELKIDVLAKNAQMGFAFHEGVWDELIKNTADGQIKLYLNPESSLEDFIKEKVFASLYKYLAFDGMVDYLDRFMDDEMPKSEERDEFLYERFTEYIKEGGVFTISYIDQGEKKEVETRTFASDRRYLFKPVRGILSVLAMLAALAGTVFLTVDEKNGMYERFGYNERPFINYSVILLPSMLSCIVAIACIFISGVHGPVLLEIGKMLVYIIALSGYCSLIRSIINNSTVLCSLMPILVVACVLGCNIIENFGALLNIVEKVKYLLIPNYYLELTYDLKGSLLALCLGIAFALVGVLIDRRRLK